jgi:hypothetical protein
MTVQDLWRNWAKHNSAFPMTDDEHISRALAVAERQVVAMSRERPELVFILRAYWQGRKLMRVEWGYEPSRGWPAKPWMKKELLGRFQNGERL